MYETTDSDDDRTNYETTGDVIRAILSALDEGDAAEVNVGHATHRVETGADVWDDEEQTEVRLTNEEIPTWAGIAPVDVEDVQPVTDDEDDDEDGPVVLPDGGQILPEDDDEGYPADPSRDETTVHGVQENTSGIVGLCVLYSVHGLHYRVRLRPVNPLDSETFDRGDAWTMFEWAEVETPDEDAPSVSFEEIHVVPAVVREVVPGPVQVPDEPGHVGGSR